jgi:two-component system sensor histidine kinase HydH
MDMRRRSLLVYGLLAAVWVLVLGWQAEEHLRVRSVAKADLRNRSKDIANTVSAIIRGMTFRGAIPEDRLGTVFGELVEGHTNDVVKSSDLLSIVLLSPTTNLVNVGRKIDLQREDLVQDGEHWGQTMVVFVNPINLGTALASDGATNPTVILPPRDPSNTNRDGGRPFPRSGPPPQENRPTNLTAVATAEPGGPGDPGTNGSPRGPRSRRAWWMRGMDEKEYQSVMETRAVHGLVLGMSTESLQAAAARDLRLRSTIIFLATLSVLGCGLAWRNVSTTSDLQIRLLRASELNTHLKEMNLAAAGLAHETRNPLNIIRGLAQMISKEPSSAPEVQKKSREIVGEADKVAAQLNEFINYSRPREVRPKVLALNSVVTEVARTLNYDVEEKKIRLQVAGDSLNVEADEQMLRQALFNLILNAIQAVNGDGEIHVTAGKNGTGEALLEVRDNGPGVPPESRAEIFKPYFTTQKTGTGLGLAVVQQIVLAHGWEIECLPNEPHGAIFRISHLKIAT